MGALIKHRALRNCTALCTTFVTDPELPLAASHPGAYQTKYTFISFSLVGSQSIVLRVQAPKKYINLLWKWYGNVSNVLCTVSHSNKYTEKLSSHVLLK